MMLIKLSTVCLFLLMMRMESGTADTSGGYSSPSGNYKLVWTYDVASNMINFTITAVQAAGTWVGLAIGPNQLMETQDTFIGYVDSSGVGHVMDMYIGAHYSPPTLDPMQNLVGMSISYTSGTYTMMFSRPRVTPDTANDVQFSDTSSYYFKYPVGGGLMSGSNVGKHTSTPIVSQSAICVCSVSGGSSMASEGSSMASTMNPPSSPPPSGGSPPPSPPPSGPSMPPSPPPSGPSMPPPSGPSMPPPSGPSMPPPSGPSMPPPSGPSMPPPSGPSMPPPSGPSMPPPSGPSMPPPSGPSMPPPSGPSMPPSPPPSGPSMPPSGPPMSPPSGPSMPPSPPPSGASMPPSPPPSGASMGPSGQPTMGPPGGMTSPPSSGGGGSSSNIARNTLIASLVVFGSLCTILICTCLCFTSSASSTATNVRPPPRRYRRF